uniref:Uncharacterized protein n=1 Tax=Picea sitchensis TaxID=3332 RepID=A9NLX5_PICSI|nr:unknown [Picea sitchensis]
MPSSPKESLSLTLRTFTALSPTKSSLGRPLKEIERKSS